jgi:hypothetical protein
MVIKENIPSEMIPGLIWYTPNVYELIVPIALICNVILWLNQYNKSVERKIWLICLVAYLPGGMTALTGKKIMKKRAKSDTC